MNRLQFVLGILVLFVSCSDGNSNPPSAQSDALNKNQQKKESLEVTGKELYIQNCAGCHGRDRSGRPPNIPAIVNIDKRRSRDWVQRQIQNGKNQMPSFSFLSEQEQTAIVEYLFGGQSETVQSSEDVPAATRGKRLFKANCSRCHRAKKDRPPPTGVSPRREPAVLAGTPKRFNRGTFDWIVLSGPKFMPSFRQFSHRDLTALWEYLKTLEGEGAAQGRTMLEMHPHLLRSAVKNLPETFVKKRAIARAIRRHIKQKQDKFGGWYPVKDEKTGQTLQLSLTRVHDDKLSPVDEDTYFACVNMESKDGTPYDIDFFLERKDEDLRVTEYDIHKVGGEPRYTWEIEDGRWKKNRE